MVAFYFILSLLASHVPFVSAQSTKTITVPAPTPPASTSYTSQDEFKRTMLTVTNRFRAEHNASALTWNSTLADTSLQWARQCHWKHSQSSSGENLAMGYPNLTAAVEAWGNERDHYNFAKPGFSEETGHFSQLVWKSTHTVGCDRFDCGTSPPRNTDKGREARGWYVVCQYWPPGNVLGDHLFQDNVQKQTATGAGGVAGTGALEPRRGCGMCAVVAMLGAVVGGMIGWA